MTTAAVSRFDAIDALSQWSTNYNSCLNPFCIFLDLIGYSVEEYGMKLVLSNTDTDISSVLGYKELCLLGDALNVFKENGYDAVYEYIRTMEEDF
jgi:hypothetical protein